jgi:hypothetical protein
MANRKAHKKTHKTGKSKGIEKKRGNEQRKQNFLGKKEKIKGKQRLYRYSN